MFNIRYWSQQTFVWLPDGYFENSAGVWRFTASRTSELSGQLRSCVSENRSMPEISNTTYNMHVMLLLSAAVQLHRWLRPGQISSFARRRIHLNFFPFYCSDISGLYIFYIFAALPVECGSSGSSDGAWLRKCAPSERQILFFPHDSMTAFLTEHSLHRL